MNGILLFSLKKDKLKSLFTIFFMLSVIFLSAQTTTSWKGTSSTNWKTAANWTNGIPTSSLDVILGDANFTGSYQPSISAAAFAKSLTLGGTKATTLTLSKKITVYGNLTINTNGTISLGRTSINIKGNWVNNGTFSATQNTSKVTFSGSFQTISGSSTTTFRKLVISLNDSVTLGANITIGGTSSSLTLNGLLDPLGFKVTASVINVGSAATLRVRLASFTDNYSVNPSLTGGSTVAYIGDVNQTVNQSLFYSSLFISGAGYTKTLGGNLASPLNSTDSAKGRLIISSGTFDIAGFTCNRGGTSAGGSLQLLNGATLKIGSTSTFPTGYNTVSLGATSTVEYYGAAQTIGDQAYGNLILSSVSASITKTILPNNPLIIYGDLVSNTSSTALVFNATNSITVFGNVTIGSNSTFGGSTQTITVSGNWTNNGTFTSTGTILFDGASKILSGTGTNTFNNVTLSGTGITTSGTVNITSSGNVLMLNGGTFTHNTGIFTMSGTNKTITGVGLSLNDFSVSGTVSTSESIAISGNLLVAGTFTANAGTITFSGTSKSISGSGTKTLFNTTFPGTYTIGVNMNINGGMTVSTGGSLTASAGLVTFGGNSSLSGTANLFSVTSSATSFVLGANAILGVGSTLTLTAGFNATSNIPNTVMFNGSGAQNIPAATYHNISTSNSGTKSVNGIINLNGTLNIGYSTTLSQGAFTMNIVQNWTNNGTFTKGTKPVVFTGSSISIISGTNSFYNISVNKSTASYYVLLGSNITTESAEITKGFLRTATNTLTITSTRTGNGFIYGNIKRTQTFTTGVAYSFEGPSNTITFASVSGVSEITVSVFDATKVIDYPNGTSINRFYNISVPNGTYDATLRLHYEDGELNGNSESTMELRNFNGTNYAIQSKTAYDITANYIEKSGLTSITNKWTIADGDNIVAWRGTNSNDWATASNWTVISGSPATPPSNADVALFGDASISNQPIITSAATAKNMLFKSTDACSITVSTSGSLSVVGNISGEWTGSKSHSINVGSRTLTAGGIVMSDNTSGHDINITTNGGTITVNNDLTLSGSATLTLQNSSALNIAGNYFNYLSGTFSAGSSTVTFNGIDVQQLPGLSFYNLTINKASGIARAIDSLTILNDLTITDGTFVVDSNIIVNGNITISASAEFYFNDATTIVSLNGNLTNNGTMYPTGSEFILTGTSSQNISNGSFHDFSINKASGTAILTSNNMIANNLNILKGSLDLGSYSADRTLTGGEFNMISGTSILVGGSNNFPSNYATYKLDSNSSTTYNGTGTQTIKNITYGHLIAKNGGSNAKTLNSNAYVLGNFNINTGATLSTSSYLLSVRGNWTNSGTFTASTGTVSLEGYTKTLNGATTFNKLNVIGTYTVNNVPLTFNDQVEVIGIFTTGTGTMTIVGNLINRGFISNNGVVTFTGTQLQTIRLINAISTSTGTVNFNGNVAPILSSNTSPQYLNLNINNTAGISPSVAWEVFGAFTVASGSSFIGGPYIHTFYNNFTNNGMIASRGTLRFNPSSSVVINFGTNFTSTGTVDLFGSGAITLSGSPITLTNISIRNTNAAGITPNIPWTVVGNFTIAFGATLNASSFTYNLDSSFTCNGILNAGSSTFNFRGKGGQINSDQSFYNVQINTGATTEALNDVYVSHNFVKNGTYPITENVLVFTGAGNSILSSSTYPFSLGFLEVDKTSTSDTVKLSGRIDLMQSIDISSGVMDADTFSIFEDAANFGDFNIDSLAIFLTKKITSPVFPVFTSTTIDDYSTVEYGSKTGGAQAINTSIVYGNLKLSGKGRKTAGAAFLVNSNYIHTGGNFVGGSYTHTIKGDWIMTTDSSNVIGTTILFNGINNQNITTLDSFNNLTVNKTTGKVTCNSSVIVNGILDLTSGVIKTGSNTMIVLNTSTTAVTRTSGWINGFLRRSIPGTGSSQTYNYFIGDSVNFTPTTVTFTSLTGAGTLTGSTIGIEHPNASSSGLNTAKGVNRYYTFTNIATTFSNYSATFNFVAGDLDAGVTTASLKAGKYIASSWTLPTTSGTTSTSFSISGGTSFGDFIASEAANKTWDGGATTLNWNDATNWNPDGVPLSSESVSIITNSGTVIVNTAAVCKDLTLGNSSSYGLQISTGNTLTVNDVLKLTSAGININGQTLTLNGSFNASGSGTITGSNTSNLIIGGSGAFGSLKMNQTTTGTTNRLNNFTFNRITSGTLSLSNILQVIGVVTPTRGTLTTGGMLILSAVSSTSYGQLSGSGTGTVSGNVTVEKVMANTDDGWRHISLPAQTKVSAITGMQVQTTANPKTNQRSVYRWDASASSGKLAKGYIEATNSDDETYAYAIYSNNTNTGIHELSSKISVTGSLIQSDYTMNLFNTRDANGVGTSNEYGWNFIPNRFASNIDVSDLIGDANFGTGYKAIHVYDKAAGQYVGINSSSLIQYNTNGTGLSTNTNIATWQGFWVKADSTGQSIQIKNIHRTTSMANVSVFMKFAPDFMRLNVKDNVGKMDQVVIQFALDANEDMDGEKDVFKFKSFDSDVPTLYTKSAGLNLSVNALPYTTTRDLDLAFESFKKNTTYTFSPDFDNFAYAGSVILEDKKTGKMTDLRTSNYQFTHNDTISSSRFVLHFSQNNASISSNTKEVNVYAYSDEEGIKIVYVNALNNSPADISITNTLGQDIFKQKNVNPGQKINFNPGNGQPQLYLISIITEGKQKVIKIIY